MITYSFDVDQSSNFSVDIENLNSAFGLVNLSLAQSVMSQVVKWNTRTLMDTLATIGGQVIAILGISKFLLTNYQKFTYNKSALKKLYYESTENQEEIENTTNWRLDMEQKLNSRQEMTFSYVTFIFVKLLSNCCCCIMRRYENEKGWYGRNKRSLAKFKIAKEKLNSEVDMKNIVTFRRISTFLHKLQTKRRQRLSVDYFRRYTVQDSEINRPKQMKRDMTQKRILSECEPGRSDIDKRILFEMTGVRLD